MTDLPEIILTQIPSEQLEPFLRSSKITYQAIGQCPIAKELPDDVSRGLFLTRQGQIICQCMRAGPTTTQCLAPNLETREKNTLIARSGNPNLLNLEP